MTTTDLREVKDRAAEHFARGRFAKAAADYGELCRREPNDAQLRVRWGEALRRCGDEAGAIEAWQVAAEGFARQGLLPRAIAACKLILDVDASHLATQRRLADLYARRTSPGSRTTAAPSSSPPPAPTRGRAAATPTGAAAGAARVLATRAAKPAGAGAKPTSSGLELDDAAKPFAHGFKGEGADPTVSASGLELDREQSGTWRGAQSWVSAEEAAASTPRAGSASGAARAWAGVADAPGSGPGEPTPPPKQLAELEVMDIDEDVEVEELVELADRPPEAAELPRIPLFSDLSKEAFVALASRCVLRGFADGDVILREGTAGGSFWVIASGTVEVRKASCPGGAAVLARLGEGEFFGEMALLSGAPRSASVVAAGEVECLEISALLLADLMRRFPHVGQVLKGFCRERLLANVLRASPLFRPFEPGERARLVQRFRPRQALAGEVLVAEGRPSEGLFVVLSGRLSVQRGKAGEVQPLALLKEGEIFGEISLLLKQPATATVTALGPVTVLQMSREAFDELISTHPQVLELVSDLCEQRLREQHVHLGEPDGLAVHWV